MVIKSYERVTEYENQGLSKPRRYTSHLSQRPRRLKEIDGEVPTRKRTIISLSCHVLRTSETYYGDKGVEPSKRLCLARCLPQRTYIYRLVYIRMKFPLNTSFFQLQCDININDPSRPFAKWFPQTHIIKRENPSTPFFLPSQTLKQSQNSRTIFD